ncbi:ClpXP protease specificity-enhancing factor [Agaribacter flavus]|uniref:ClpXP protease specificity-enhancing factor n=1 Tax=Agaribacter flavus TaxID=1902781 RepID=A0ABV7FRK1_9ALTE
MTSNQPYLLKAFYDWIVDNGLTPYVVVSTRWPNVDVPMQFVKDDQIVLNISPAACVNFVMDVDAVSFQARFGGQPTNVMFPCEAVGAIYAKENGAGTVFTQELPAVEEQQNTSLGVVEDNNNDSTPPKPSPEKPKSKANLRVIK